MDAFAKETGDGWTVIRFALTHALLARCLGVTTRSVDRTLSSWTSAGLVENRRGFLAFRSRDELVELAGEERLALFTRLGPAVSPAADDAGSTGT
jgi:hypothetical protein